MASANSDAGPAPTDVSTTQPAGIAKKSRAAPQDWPTLLHLCEELDITALAVNLEHESIEAELEAINTAKTSPAWKATQRKKLRIKLQRHYQRGATAR